MSHCDGSPECTCNFTRQELIADKEKRIAVVEAKNHGEIPEGEIFPKNIIKYITHIEGTLGWVCTYCTHPIAVHSVEHPPSPPDVIVALQRPEIFEDKEPLMKPLIDTCSEQFEKMDLFAPVTTDFKTMQIVEAVGEAGRGKTVATGEQLFRFMETNKPGNSAVSFYCVQFTRTCGDHIVPRNEAVSWLQRELGLHKAFNLVLVDLQGKLQCPLFVLLQIDEWHINPDLCHELVKYSFHSCKRDLIKVVVSVAGFKTLLDLPSQTDGVNCLPSSDGTIYHLKIPRLTEVVPKRLISTGKVQGDALTVVTTAISGNPRCLRAVLDVLSNRAVLTMTRADALALLSQAVTKYRMYNGGIDRWLGNNNIEKALWIALSGRNMSTKSLVDVGFASPDATEGDVLELNAFHVWVVISLMSLRDPATWISPSGEISGESFEQLASMCIYARLNMIQLNFPTQTEIAVSELFHGFHFSKATGQLKVPISKLCGIQKLRFQFPTAKEAKAKDFKLDESKLIINGDQASYADAIVPCSRLLIQYKKNEKFEQTRTISRFDVAFEACKAGFPLSAEMRKTADDNARKAPVREKVRLGDASTIENSFTEQCAATLQLTSRVFVFLTDKRIPFIKDSINDGLFVIMDATNAELCMPSFVRLGFVFGAKREHNDDGVEGTESEASAVKHKKKKK
jgi:hypothetical protein